MADNIAKKRIEELTEAVDQEVAYSSPAIHTKLMEESCRRLEHLLGKAHQLKGIAINHTEENIANIFLGFECSISALRSFIRMWILIKNDQPNRAWNELISAQMAALDATRAHEDFLDCADLLEKLELVEREIMPPQTFMSTGFVVKTQLCNICEKSYRDCNHLANRPYMGILCKIQFKGTEANHISIVDVPADKRCRVTQFQTENGYRDKLSWQLTAYSEEDTYDSESFLVKSIMFNLDSYPYLTPNVEVLNMDNDSN